MTGRIQPDFLVQQEFVESQNIYNIYLFIIYTMSNYTQVQGKVKDVGMTTIT